MELSNLNIHDIEDMKEAEAQGFAIETMEIKGFQVYFIDLVGYFGYSYLVFKNGHQINYANDYELHHHHLMDTEGREGLRKYYIESLNRKLYTDEEIGQPLTDYDEYDMKSRFLRDFYALQEDHISMFGNFNDPEYTEWYRKKTATMVFNRVGCCYMDNAEFVKHHCELMDQLKKAKDAMSENFEYQKNAFLTEMYNHEYGINWQADYDTLSAFGNIQYHGEDEDELSQYFNELHFTDTQKNAYRAARQEYYNKYKELSA